MRRIRYAVAMSLDGYTANPEEQIEWLSKYPEGDGEAFVGLCDTVLVGRKMYEAAQKHGPAGWSTQTRTYVFSRTLRQADLTNLTVVAGNVKEVVTALKQEPGKDIWLMGGSGLFGSLLEIGLVDTVEVGIIPVILGAGVPLLSAPGKQVRLRLTATRVSRRTGMVWLAYAVKCPTCATIGRRVHVDHDENERFPDGVRAYRTLGRREDLRCCPHCGTSYRHASVTDNDIYCAQHTETLTEVTESEVEEQLEQERRESEEYHEAFSARFRKALLTLSAGEREVLDYLLERWWHRQNLADLKGECAGGTALPELLSGLVAKGLVEEARHGALLVGKDGKYWSQESPDWNITYALKLSGHDLDKWRKRRRSGGDLPPR